MPATDYRTTQKAVLFNVLNPYLCAKRPGLSTATVDTYERWAQYLYRAFGRDFRVDRMVPGDVRSRLREVYPDWGGERLNQVLAWFDSAQRHALALGTLASIRPLPRMIEAKKGRRPPREYGHDEVRRLMRARSPRARAIVVLAARCGLRPVELRHLMVGDLDFEQDMIHVRERDECDAFPRVIPMGFARGVLEVHVRTCTRGQPGEWLFHGRERGKVASSALIDWLVRQACVQTKTRFQGLWALRRHWLIVARYTDKLPLDVILQRGGWRSERSLEQALENA